MNISFRYSKILKAVIVAATILGPLGFEHISSAATNEKLTRFDINPRFESSFPNPARVFRYFDYDLSQTFLKQEEVTYYAMSYSKLTHVPYIWGGGEIGSEATSSCTLCKRCIKSKKVGVKKRFESCKACQKCGMDCSHLVNRIFDKADLHVPYGSTRDLLNRNTRDLARLYSLINIGSNSAKARAGDLILYPKHIVLLLDNNQDGTGSIVHATAKKKNTKYGGILIETINLNKYAGGIKKILRHRKMVEMAEMGAPIPNAPKTAFLDTENESFLTAELPPEPFADLLANLSFDREPKDFPN